VTAEFAFRKQRYSEAQMAELAAALAAAVRSPLVVYLEGDLGAGKTTLARALIQALGHPGRVKSPTYGLLEHYEIAGLGVLHLDLYRIGDPGEIEFLGIEDLFDIHTILLVEWPERGGDELPPADIVIHFEHAGDTRELTWTVQTEQGRAVCQSLADSMQ
jgi:tRNA threonylcarbamoyladenosine biosynthesis protein TsaE